MLPALLATVLFSVSVIAANRSVRFMGGTEANFWRLALATLLLGLYAYALGGGTQGGAFPILFISGCIGFGFGDLALFQALPRIGSRLSTLLVHCLASPLAALTEWLWLGTRLTLPEIFSSLTILAGVAVALAPNDHRHLPRAILFWGVVYATIAAFGQAFGAVLSRRAFQVAAALGQNLDGITAAYQRILGGLLVAGVALLLVRRSFWAPWQERPVVLPARTSEKWRRSFPWLALNALTGPTLGVSCYQWALKTAPTGIVMPIVAITPLVVIPLAQRMEHEKPSARSLWGGLIAVAGAIALALV